MNQFKVEELLLQSLEAEIGGVRIYETAITCAVHPSLASEWKKYLEETRNHVATLQSACVTLDIDPQAQTAGRAVVRHLGAALVSAMKMAREAGDADAAQIVACECVMLAETKDHSDWELIGQVGKHAGGEVATVLLEIYEDIEDEEDSHLYHSKGWCRELWVEALGLEAVLPPPEEQLEVKTAIGAARAQASARASRHVGDTEPGTAR